MRRLKSAMLQCIVGTHQPHCHHGVEHMTWSGAQWEWILFCHGDLEAVSGSDIGDDVSSSWARSSAANWQHLPGLNYLATCVHNCATCVHNCANFLSLNRHPMLRLSFQLPIKSPLIKYLPFLIKVIFSNFRCRLRFYCSNSKLLANYFNCCFSLCAHSRTPLLRPPLESHWCGRIRGMVVREGLDYYITCCRPRETQRPIHYSIVRHVRTLAV